jgi:hypothetical protein
MSSFHANEIKTKTRSNLSATFEPHMLLAAEYLVRDELAAFSVGAGVGVASRARPFSPEV